MIRKFLRISGLLAVMTLPLINPASAADPVPGQSCSGYTSGAFMRSGGPENSGSYYYMSCTGGVWTTVTSLPSCAVNYAPIKDSNGSWICYCPGGYGGTATWAQQTGSGSRSWGVWHSLASSADGTKVIASLSSGRIYRSTDSGATWGMLATSTSGAWNTLASSADGLTIAGIIYNNKIYVSPDGGANWNIRDSNRTWSSLDMSADGTKMAAAVGSSGYVYTSIDSGATWVAKTASGLRDWSDIKISDDGQVIVAVAWSNKVYLSIDAGTTWNALNADGANGNYEWNAVEMSPDGMVITVAAHDPDYIYKSTNRGTTWTKLTNSGARAWEELAMSDDGQVIIGAADASYLFLSRDGGSTFTQQTSSPGALDFEGLVVTPDGSIIYAADNTPGYIWKMTGTACQAPP